MSDAGDWVAELQLQLGMSRYAGDGAYTVYEMSQATGACVSTVGRRLREMIASGTMEYAGTKKIMTISGMQKSVPAYRIAKKGKRK
jgi:hypothetical protein